MISALDLLLVVFVGLAALFDLKERRIPNWLILFALTGGVLLNSWQGMSHVIDAGLGFGLGIGALFLPFALGWIGAGDVKLVGAIGAILGRTLLPRVLLYSALAGGVLAIYSLLRNGINWQRIKSLWQDVSMLIYSQGVVLPETMHETKLTRAHTVPYGVAITIGTLIAVYLDPKGEWAGF